MTRFLIVLCFLFSPVLAAMAFAQSSDLPSIQVPELDLTPDTNRPEDETVDDGIPDAPDVVPAPNIPILPDLNSEDGSEAEDGDKRKDLTVRSETDRQDILDELFSDLQASGDPESAELIAEEIWAVFLQSRSASVDFLLLRGIAAQGNGDLILARRMFDHVLRLQPEFAEGWSRSGRLAIEENDLSRAANDITQALLHEPRHFYALWTLGNILEKLGRAEEAFEAYEEAHRLYPQHQEIKERVDTLGKDALGQAL